MRALVTSGLHMYVQIHPDDTFYIALAVTSLHCTATGVDMQLRSAHITIGTYRMEPEPKVKQRSDAVKCQRLRDRLIIESQQRVEDWVKPRWSGRTRQLPIKLLMKSSGSDPAIFDLLLAAEAHSVDKLVVQLESAYGGNFTATHGSGRRSMLYIENGPNFHLSIYGGMQVNMIPESASSEEQS